MCILKNMRISDPNILYGTQTRAKIIFQNWTLTHSYHKWYFTVSSRKALQWDFAAIG